MDRLASELERLGMPTAFQNLARDGRMGRMVRHGNTEICFAIEDDDETVVLTDYRRIDSRSNLATGFRSLMWFVRFVADRPQLGLKRLHGLIRPDKTQGGISTDRLAAAYRLLGGRHEATIHGEEWMVVEFAEYRRRPTRFARPAAVQEAHPHG
jgi:hypothetical protein